MDTNRNRAVIGILILVFFFFIILMTFVIYTFKALKSTGDMDIDEVDEKIAVVEIKGAILESRPTIEKLHRAEKDKETKAIIVRINSPGGGVAPTQEIYQEMKRIDEKIPVYASLASVAASGGYYIAAAARKIYANPGSMVGSIGVILPYTELTELFKWAKVKPSPITSGKFKDIASTHRPMREDEKAILQAMLSDVHQQFINDIEKNRKKALKVGRSEYAEGQIFSGQQAYDLGMVDGLGSLWEVGRIIHEELKLSGEFGLRFIKKRKESKFLKLLENLDEVASNIDMLSKNYTYPMYLMGK